MTDQLPIKSKSRIPSCYEEGTKDWEAEYNMLLPDGITCMSCVNCKRCCTIFGQEETDITCQWYPSRFKSI